MDTPSPGIDPDEPEPEPPLRDLDPELPEADVIEQHQAADPEVVVDELDSVPVEVPEADAIEQATPAPVEDEYPDS
jgi:hypothetical protein